MIERIIMESLGEGKKDKDQLFFDTKLDVELLENVLDDLGQEGLVYRDGEHYGLNRKKIKLIKDRRGVKNEVRELFVSWVNRFFVEEKEASTCLKIKKVSMNDAEEMLYNEHLKKLNSFIESIKETSLKEKRRCATAKKKVIFWGHGEYQGLVESSLKSF